MDASTFVRAGLDRLTAENDTVVIAEAIDAESYWNSDGTFMLTDVRLEVLDLLKGRGGHSELTVTLLGGTIGDLSTVIVGGAELRPGNSYLLFVDTEDLPGAPSVRTLRDHAQGAFDIVADGTNLRAVSQAKDETLVPDSDGEARVPFGAEGAALEEIAGEIRALVKAQGRKP